MPIRPATSNSGLRSERGVTLVAILVVGMIVTLVGLMTLPALTNEHDDSREKQVLGNLRQLADAAQLHFLRTGENIVTFDQLVGTGKPISELPLVAGERYPMVIQRNQTEFIATGSTIPGKPVIKYSP